MQQPGGRNADYSLTRLPIEKAAYPGELINSGRVPLPALQEMGGWESIEMVRRYAHLSPAHLQEHAKNIDDIFNAHGTNMARKNAV